MSSALDEINKQVTSFILNPKYHDPLTVVKAFRNGLVYGAKIRFPHALVMAILFGRGSAQERFKFILSATRQHGFTMAKFATLYMGITIWLRRQQGKPTAWQNAFAGGLGGYLIFGERNAINEQVVMYTFARVAMSMLPRQEVPSNWPAHKGIPVSKPAFAVFAAVSWAFVMYGWGAQRQRYQLGIVNSAHYIYGNAEKWDSIRNFIWHNT